jgi:hypothetical protein
MARFRRRIPKRQRPALRLAALIQVLIILQHPTYIQLTPPLTNKATVQLCEPELILPRKSSQEFSRFSRPLYIKGYLKERLFL